MSDSDKENQTLKKSSKKESSDCLSSSSASSSFETKKRKRGRRSPSPSSPSSPSTPSSSSLRPKYIYRIYGTLRTDYGEVDEKLVALCHTERDALLYCIRRNFDACKEFNENIPKELGKKWNADKILAASDHQLKKWNKILKDIASMDEYSDGFHYEKSLSLELLSNDQLNRMLRSEKDLGNPEDDDDTNE